MEEPWIVTPSHIAIQSANPIDDFLTKTKEISPEANILDLTTGNLCTPPDEIISSLLETIAEGRHNGYAPSVGYEDTRLSILNYLKLPSFNPKDIILSSGTSSCLDIAITALADRGQNILIPKPCNPLYKLLAHGIGIETRDYDLSPVTWDIDLMDLRQKIDLNTALILVNNPHNPTGAVYTREHLQNILEVAENLRVPVVVDEAYRDAIIPGEEFVSAVEVNTKVPLLVCGGIGRSFMVPGWRIGWILVHDPVEAFSEVRKALVSLSQRIIGCNTVLQGALCRLEVSDEEFREGFMQIVKDNGVLLKEKLNGKFALFEVNPGKSVFCFVKVDFGKYPELGSGEEFCRRMYQEIGVLVLPGELFGIEGYIRIALDINRIDMEEAVARIEQFSFINCTCEEK